VAHVFESLRHRTFRTLFIARTVDALGDAVVPAALALAVFRTTGSTSALALVLSCALIPRLLLLPLGGVLADRLRPLRVAVAADILRAVLQLIVGLELLGTTPTLWHIAVASALSGAASAFALPTQSPLVAGAVNEEIRQQANALISSAQSAIRLAGPALAGVLIFTVGPGWAFLLDAATFAISALLLLTIRINPAPAAPSTLRRDLVEGWREVRTRDWYWTSLIAHAIWNFAFAIMLTIGPAVAVSHLGGEWVWVAMLEASAIGYLCGSMLATKVTPRRPVLTANLGLATFAVPLGLMGTFAPALLVIAAYAVAMVALGFLNPLWETVVQAEVPEAALARVTSYDWLVSLAAMPLGYALAPVAARWSTPGGLYVAAAMVLVASAATALIPAVRNIRLSPANRSSVSA
jgi:Major Facilitator Superfamily